MSPSLFCVYLDTLLDKLRSSGVGCHLGGSFCGAFGYADDVTLLAPTRQALQIMLDICQDFSSSHSMLFSTDPVPSKSKTKCMFFSRMRSSDQIKNVELNGDSLPWVDKAKHLGNQLSSNLNLTFSSPETKSDLLCKRAIFFQNVHQILQQFGAYEPKLIINLLSIYSTAFYGSSLWQLNSEEHFRLNRSWNTAVRMIWNLPIPTHTRFLESLSPIAHLEATLHTRYIGFVANLSSCSKPFITLLFNSVRGNLSSMTGSNITYLLGKYSKPCLKDLIMEKFRVGRARVNPISETEVWKVKMIEEISLILKGHLEMEFDTPHLEEVLRAICTN